MTAPFQFLIIPDTQFYCGPDGWEGHFEGQMQYIVDNYASENIAFVSHVGDVVNIGSSATEWARAKVAIDKLHTVNVPHSIVPGNHDASSGSYYPSSTADWTAYLALCGANQHAAEGWYGGAFSNGTSYDEVNHYELFTVNRRTFLHIGLQYEVTDPAFGAGGAVVRTWAQSILDAYPSTPTIITTHDADNNAGDSTYTTLAKENSQVFMIISGHDGNAHSTLTNDAGSDCYMVLCDYQAVPEAGDPYGDNPGIEGGAGLFKVLEFDEVAGKINVTTRTETYNINDLTVYDETYSFTVNFNERFGNAAMFDYNLKQSTSVKCPTLQESPMSWNREPTLTLDGGDVMASADLGKILGGKQASTVMMVVEGGTQTVAWPMLIRVQSGGNAHLSINFEASSGIIYVSQTDDSGSAKLIQNTVGSNPLEKTVICFRNSGTTSGASLFVSSVSDKSSATAFNDSADDVTLSDAVTYLGGQAADGTNPFVGSISTLAFYDYALTDAQVSEAMTAMRDEYCVQGWGYDGTNSDTEISHSTDMDLDATEWTICFWFKSDTGRDGNTIYYVSGGAGAGGPHSYNFYSAAGEAMKFIVEGADGEDVVIDSTADLTGDTDWHHFCATCTTGGVVKVYCNGVQVGTGTNAALTAVDVSAGADGVIVIGTRADNDGTRRASGVFRDFAIFNDRAISLAELAEIVSGGYAADADTPTGPDVNIVMTAAEAATVTAEFESVGTGHKCTHSSNAGTSYVTGEYK